MFKKWIKISIVMSLVLILFSTPLVIVYYERREQINNPCIFNTPRDIAYGRIIHDRGLLTNPAPRYVVYYKGNTKETGEECVVGTTVTEQQYGYLMYRNNE